jgi:hypothetical protein
MVQKFAVLFEYQSDVLDCSYRFGKLGEEFVYVWTNRDVEIDEIPEDGLVSPENLHGAIIGTLEEVRDDYENCVGAFRSFDNPEAEEAHIIVDGANEAFGVAA